MILYIGYDWYYPNVYLTQFPEDTFNKKDTLIHVSEQANNAISTAKSYAESKVNEINSQLTQNINEINSNMESNIASINKNLDGDGIITVAEKKALIREWETLKGSSVINETIIGFCFLPYRLILNEH